MKDLICKHCQKNFKHYFEEWHEHLKKVHGIIPKMQCKTCDLVCIGIEEFDRHQEFDHGKKLTSLCLAFKDYKRKLKNGEWL